MREDWLGGEGGGRRERISDNMWGRFGKCHSSIPLQRVPE